MWRVWAGLCLAGMVVGDLAACLFVLCLWPQQLPEQKHVCSHECYMTLGKSLNSFLSGRQQTTPKFLRCKLVEHLNQEEDTVDTGVG